MMHTRSKIKSKIRSTVWNRYRSHVYALIKFIIERVHKYVAEDRSASNYYHLLANIFLFLWKTPLLRFSYVFPFFFASLSGLNKLRKFLSFLKLFRVWNAHFYWQFLDNLCDIFLFLIIFFSSASFKPFKVKAVKNHPDHDLGRRVWPFPSSNTDRHTSKPMECWLSLCVR